MSDMFNVIVLVVNVIVLFGIIVYADIIADETAQIKEIAECFGWADLDKVRALDKKKYLPKAKATEEEYFTMPDGEKVRRRECKRRKW